MAQQKSPHISFLIVTYNSTSALRRCVRDILRIAEGHHYEILIADNDQKHPITQQDITHKTVRVFPMRNNSGFGVANNYIARKATGDYFFFLNPDTVDITGSLEKFLHEARTHNIGILAPQILDRTGTPEKWSCGTSPVTPLRIIVQNIFPKDSCASVTYSDDLAWVSGAAFIIARRVFEDVGGFDERYFLYYEDVDLCRRVKTAGYRIAKSDTLTLQHNSGTSMPSRHVQKTHYDNSQRIYVTKYYKPVWRSIITGMQKIKRAIQKL